MSRLSDSAAGGADSQPAPPPPPIRSAEQVKLNINFSTQNCNSFNVSGITKNTKSKVTSIINFNTDIIFLSDTRLGNKARHISDLFRLKYRFYSNSTMNKRGVAILIRNEFDFTLTDTFPDPDENVLLISGLTAGKKILLGAIYGPNENNRVFFEFIERIVTRYRDHAVIIGGDWNTTVSAAPVDNNPDVFNMRAIPSQERSAWLSSMMDSCNLIDPFRYLNPTLTDFSYFPYGTVRKNRSRIDFFLVSDSLAACLKFCDIAHGICKRYFDHKSVKLQLGPVRKKGRQAVNNRITFNPLFRFFVILAMYESYIEHTVYVRHGILDAMLSNLCVGLDNTANQISQLMSFCDPWSWKPLTDPEKASRDLLLTNVEQQLGTIMSLDEISRLPRNIDDDEFFEVLIFKINKAVLDLQCKSVGAEKIRIKFLKSELNQLKKNYIGNRSLIGDLEDELGLILEAELEDKIRNYIKTESLNQEKMTPTFLNMAKSFTNDSISVICDGDGIPFGTAAGRGEFIADFYRNLYEIPAAKPLVLTGCIETFLGPDILNNPIVSGMKLTEEERTRLDTPISLTELDKAIKTANKRSAPGIDGVSNVMISKIWDLIRIPLHNYAHCCFRKGKLTKTFRTACIRLIPKKGNTKQIKNWRPISLLSCYYKIISRVINTRLGTVIDKITGRIQKAYNSKKFIHEVVINLCNNIEHCNKNNVPGMIVSIDQTKAFDSIYHDFCDEAFRFFGFGESFISMMSTLGTGRNAKVILEDGNFSGEVALHRGRPQGDSPSPRQYNIGEQICLLKIEYDPRIESVFDTRGAPQPLEHFHVGNKISKEVIQGSDKADAFADDTNVTGRQKASVLNALREILLEFAVISGLNCNLEKTCIMPIGPLDPGEWEQIVNLGFKIVDSLQVLGFRIGPDGLMVNEILETAHAKINQLIGCWSRFNLSLKGRISISKTLLISQVTYLGPILDPSNLRISQIQSAIDSFVIRGAPVAANRKYVSPSMGGLGLIKISDLWDSLKCSWFKRIFSDGINDNWRLNISSACFNNFICFRPDPELAGTRPVEAAILGGFWRFLLAFWSTNENFLEAPLINNPLFIRGRGDNGRIDDNVVDERIIGRDDFALHKESWLKLLIKDLWSNGVFTSYENLKTKVGHDFSFVVYLHLRKAAAHSLVKYKNRSNSNGTSISLFTFFARAQKGSKHFRKVMLNDSTGTGVKGMNIIRTFFSLINEEVPENDKNAISYLGLWNKNYWPVGLSSFVYQLFSNSLPVAARLGNRYRDDQFRDIDERCGWCAGDGYTVPARETFGHLYFDCPTTMAMLKKFAEKYLPPGLSDTDKKKSVILGLDGEGEKDDYLQIVFIIFLYCIWQGKIRKRPISFPTIEENMFHLFNGIAESYKWVYDEAVNRDDFWSRSWRGRTGGGRG